MTTPDDWDIDIPLDDPNPKPAPKPAEAKPQRVCRPARVDGGDGGERDG